MSADQQTYAPYNVCDYTVPFRLQLTRVGDALSGAIGGNACLIQSPGNPGLLVQVGPRKDSGHDSDPYNTYNTASYCEGRGIRWTMSSQRP